jgi:hypothetical protein
MALNKWGEPMPVKLTGPLARAWARVLVANEYFDGEDGIAYGVQQRLIREWNENGPAEVIEYQYGSREPKRTRFEHRQDAERYADRSQSDLVYATSVFART